MSNLSEVLEKWKDGRMSNDSLKFYLSKIIKMECVYCKNPYDLDDIEFTDDGYHVECRNTSCVEESGRIISLVRKLREGRMTQDEFISRV